MTLDELQTKLQTRREKWKNHYPKNEYEDRWPEFRVDKSHALYLKNEIERLKSEQDQEAMVREIFK